MVTYLQVFVSKVPAQIPEPALTRYDVEVIGLPKPKSARIRPSRTGKRCVAILTFYSVQDREEWPAAGNFLRPDRHPCIVTAANQKEAKGKGKSNRREKVFEGPPGDPYPRMFPLVSSVFK